MGNGGKCIRGMDKSVFQNKKVIDKFINIAGNITGKKFSVFKDEIKNGFINTFHPFRMFAVADKKSLFGKIEEMLKKAVGFYGKIFFYHGDIFLGLHLYGNNICFVKKQVIFVQMKCFFAERNR